MSKNNMATAQFVRHERGRYIPRGRGFTPSSTRKPGPDAKQFIPTCFEEMQIPRLTFVENRFKGTDRDIIICCKKCEAYPKPAGPAEVYKWIKLEDFVKWFKRPEGSHDGTEPTMQLVDITCCISPMEFYFVWKNADFYLSKLLRRWMHTLIVDQDERFSEFNSPTDVKVGQYVTAFYHRDGRWYRAKVLSKHGKIHWSVQLLDDGTKMEVGLERLRHLPPELHSPRCRPLAVRCQLAGLEVFSQSIQEKVIYAFVKAIRYIKHLQAAIQYMDETTKICSVTLWDLENADININDIVIEAANRCVGRQDPQLELLAEQKMKDMMALTHMNYEIEIRDFSEFKLKGLRHWRVTHVVNPHEFYMEYVYSTNTHLHKHWHERLQKFYNDPLTREGYRVETSRIYKRRHYVFCNKNEKVWQRVRCLDSDLTTRTATVYLVDLGTSQVVSYEDLWEMNRDFCGYSARAFKTSLVDVIPAGNAWTWPKESIEAFKYLVMGQDKVFHGVIVSGTIMPNPIGGRGEETMELGVILVEKNPRVTYTVQAALVVFGFAESTGISSSRIDIFEHSGFGKEGHFDFEAFKAYEEGNPLPDERVSDSNSQLSAHVLGTDRLEMLPIYPINLPEELSYSAQLLEAYKAFSVTTPVNNEKWNLPKEIFLALPKVKLVHIINPGCMYILKSAAHENLMEMTAAIAKCVKNEKAVTVGDIKVGDFVAVFQQLRSTDDPCWYRGCVRKVIGTLEIAKLVLVDNGSEVLAKFNVTRLLPTFFRDIPGFAYRIHLDIPKLIPVGSITWSSTCTTNFPRYIHSWDDVDPGYYIWSPPSSTVLRASVIHEQIVYNRTAGTWNMAPSLNPSLDTDSEDPLTLFRDDPLLFNLFYSHGVGLDFEIKTPELQGHGFQRMSDLLIKMGFATYKTN